MILSVPEFDAKPWPTLGPLVCAFIEDHLVHGPGDLRGAPAKLDDEKRALIYRMYEVHAKTHASAGRRRFKRVAISLRKGSAKTELAAWIAICELHPDGPVRCAGFDKRGNPIGGGVTDPYIPMVAYTEEQSEELAFGAMRVIIEESDLRKDFDIGLERIVRKDGSGKALPMASSPNSADGARTTFQIFDETHRMVLPRLRNAHKTMMANIPKRKLADAWSLETTTAPAPGEGSIAEDTMAYAEAIEKGKHKDAKLFFFHRQASDEHDLTTVKGVKAAVKEAAGPVGEWSDLETIADQWRDPTADKTYLERVWLNRLVRAADRAFDFRLWAKLARPGYVVAPGSAIALGFDGARYHDATSLVGTEIPTGFQWPIRIWEKPETGKDESGANWEVPRDEVDAAVAAAFETYDVWRLYADPPFWEETVAIWAGKYGEERVVAWFTIRPKAMAYAVRGYTNAMADGSLSHDGDPRLAAHIGNAYRRKTGIKDEQGQPLHTIQKERKDSPRKIDAAMAGCLSWEARMDAVAAGVANAPEEQVYAVEWV